MYREAIKQLELWKRGADRKPLVLRGARQVGKTWLMKEFGKQYYEKFYWRAEKRIINRDMKRVREIQNRLLYAYENDLSKHAPKEIVTRIRMLWNSIPAQLAKENKKFVYGLIREGARAREYQVAIIWLMDVGLVYRIGRVKKPDFPLYNIGSLNRYLKEKDNSCLIL